MDYDKIRIPFEKQLKQDLFDLFEADIIEDIIQRGIYEEEKDRLLKMHEGNSFKITKTLSSRLYHLCETVKKSLKFPEPVEFFIINSSTTNAYAIPRLHNGEVHIISITSALAEKFDDEEMKFILGHEFGHLQSNNASFERTIRFIFPDFENIPMIFRNKISLWYRLSELTADRFGFLASQNLEKCISAFFKLSSGLSLEKIDFNIKAYLAEIDNVVERFKKEPFVSKNSHPVNPIRIKALEYFSQYWISLPKGKSSQNKEDQINLKIDELMELLMVLSDSMLDQHQLNFIASGGLLAALADHEIADVEMEKIVEVLSPKIMFPKQFLESIFSSKENIVDIFKQSVKFMLSVRPGDKYLVVRYLLDIILSDRKITRGEIDFVYNIGENLLGMSKQEIAQVMQQGIKMSFMPKLYN